MLRKCIYMGFGSILAVCIGGAAENLVEGKSAWGWSTAALGTIGIALIIEVGE